MFIGWHDDHFFIKSNRSAGKSFFSNYEFLSSRHSFSIVQGKKLNIYCILTAINVHGCIFDNQWDCKHGKEPNDYKSLLFILILLLFIAVFHEDDQH